MLGKLIKNEFKATSRLMILLNIFVAIITLIGTLILIFAFSDVSSVWSIILGTLFFILYLFSIFSVFIVLSIYIASRFYKNIYTNEGYLMHTLPVSPRELLLSKYFVSGIYTLLTGITITISFCVLALNFYLGLEGTIQDLQLFYFEFLSAIAVFPEQLNISFIEIFLYVIIYIFVLTFANCSIIFLSISLGQLFTKQKILGAIISYFGIYTLLQTINSLIILPLNFNVTFNISISNDLSSLKLLMWSTVLISLTYTIVSYIITESIMSNKLNLD